MGQSLICLCSKWTVLLSPFLLQIMSNSACIQIYFCFSEIFHGSLLKLFYNLRWNRFFIIFKHITKIRSLTKIMTGITERDLIVGFSWKYAFSNLMRRDEVKFKKKSWHFNYWTECSDTNDPNNRFIGSSYVIIIYLRPVEFLENISKYTSSIYKKSKKN